MDETIAARDIARLDFDTQMADAAERVKHQVLLMNRGMQALLIINGGALIALFWLIGSNAHTRMAVNFVWWSFAAFAIGVVLSLLAYLGAFFSQGYFHCTALHQAWDAQRVMCGMQPNRGDAIAKSHLRGRLAELGGIAASVLALTAFTAGCGLALAGVLPRA